MRLKAKWKLRRPNAVCAITGNRSPEKGKQMHPILKFCQSASLVAALVVASVGTAMAQTTRAGTVGHRGSETPENETVPVQRGGPQNEIVPAQRGTLSAPSDLVLWRVERDALTLIWMDNTSFEFGVEVERGTPTRERNGVNYNWERVFNVEERVQSRVEGTGMRSDEDDGLAPGTQYCYRLRAYRAGTFSDYSAPECTQTQE